MGHAFPAVTVVPEGDSLFPLALPFSLICSACSTAAVVEGMALLPSCVCARVLVSLGVCVCVCVFVRGFSFHPCARVEIADVEQKRKTSPPAHKALRHGVALPRFPRFCYGTNEVTTGTNVFFRRMAQSDRQDGKGHTEARTWNGRNASLSAKGHCLPQRPCLGHQCAQSYFGDSAFTVGFAIVYGFFAILTAWRVPGKTSSWHAKSASRSTSSLTLFGFLCVILRRCFLSLEGGVGMACTSFIAEAEATSTVRFSATATACGVTMTTLGDGEAVTDTEEGEGWMCTDFTCVG